jgi:Sulfotransferase family
MARPTATAGRLPDFFLIGAPKAGTTALHAALAQHPQLHLSAVKEPKYYLCGDSPPPTYKGPGDAHSNQEWIWQRSRYQELFAGASEGARCGESTPFYLNSGDALRRIADDVPDARLIAVLRDPVDRAYSNWMHLWVDGLEPCADIVEACRREPERIAAGWAPFWHYQSVGMYGGQLARLFGMFPREQVLVLRYRDLVDTPEETLNRVAGFLDVEQDAVVSVPADNSRPFVGPGLRTKALGSVVRAGARAGAYLPPQVWRRASKPLLDQLRSGSSPERPKLTAEQREVLRQPFLDDIALLEEVTGSSFDEWRAHRDGESFHSRREERAPTD